MSLSTSTLRWPSRRKYRLRCLRSGVTTGASTSPTARTEVRIWAYFWLFLVPGRRTLRGTRFVRGTTTLSRLKPRITPFPVCSFVISVPPCDARCKRLRHGGEPLCAQERREALVGQEVLLRLDNEEKPRLREVRLARQQTLLVCLALVNAQQVVRRRALGVRMPAQPLVLHALLAPETPVEEPANGAELLAPDLAALVGLHQDRLGDRKSTRLNSSH